MIVELLSYSGKFSQILTTFIWKLIRIIKFGSDFDGHVFFGGFMAATKYSANPDIWWRLGRLVRCHPIGQMALYKMHRKRIVVVID